MKPFTICTGIAAALPRNNVDTDLIIRIERISKLRRGEFGPWAFESLRYHADGTEDDSFVLNRAPFRDARILISGANFGCGSSREMAVWALEEFGIRCVIAQSFGDIFYSNCFQNGLLPIILPAAQTASLATAAAAGCVITVDLPAGVITGAGLEPMPFSVPPDKREALLLGLDDIGVTLTHADAIERFRACDRRERPWVYAATAEESAYEQV